MEENDRLLAKSKAEIKLLIDSSAFISLQAIAVGTGTQPLNLLSAYPNIDYFFANSMVNELIKGREGISHNTVNMMRKVLQDEHATLDDSLKDARHLYNAKDGTVKWATLTTVSAVDYGQILLCQNHHDLVLLTNDHRMLKNAAALLDRRLMDVENLLELMIDTPNKTIREEWRRIYKWFKKNSGYRRPKTVRFIMDRKPNEPPAHLEC